MSRPKYILSVFCGHDSSVTLLRDGTVAAAITQERLDRIKHSNATGKSLYDEGASDEWGFPTAAVRYCLDAEGIRESCVELYTTNYDGEVPELGGERVPFPSHHLCHAAAAFYPSGSSHSAILVMDYAGETIRLNGEHFVGYERESAWVGNEHGLSLVWRHLGNIDATLFGLGCTYNQVAAYLFGAGDAEGKLMALAPYGRPNRELGEPFFVMEDGQVYVKPSRLFRQSQERPPTMRIDTPHYECELDWGALPPSPIHTGKISQFHRDLAFRIQHDLENAVVYLARHLRIITGARNLALSGGVAMNCIANMKVAQQAGFETVYVPPAAGDAGQSLGAAVLHWRQNGDISPVDLNGGYTGRQYHDREIEAALFSAKRRISYRREENIAGKVARCLANGELVAWFQGRSEFGPRALGARSILADPRSLDTIEQLNKVVKRREWFQPIAPSVMVEECGRYFLIRESPFMCIGAEATAETLRSAPGIVHKDGTSRVHTVDPKTNPLYHQLLKEFCELTGLPMVANTSFNGKGEPIVETPLEAVETMLRMPLDGLAIGSFLVTRKSGTE